MATRTDSWNRLRAEAWLGRGILAKSGDSSARFQTLAGGSGDYVYDDYWVTLSSMPSTLTPQSFLGKFAISPNGAVNNGAFNAINRFTKRTGTPPAIGDIYDINIMGPDNGSIILVELSPDFGKSATEGWFDIATIECAKYGTHPEHGAREFGFEAGPRGTTFYTRGVSRPINWAVGVGGAVPQRQGWLAMMRGIRDTIVKQGGVAAQNPIGEHKEKRST